MNEIPHYLRRDYNRVEKVSNAGYIVIAILLTLFMIAFFVDNFTGATTIARAAEPEVIHQNDYYCQVIKETGEDVKGAGDLVQLCKSYGVNL